MFTNTKKQGDWGLGQAIAYFTSIGYTVALPLTDSQDYDLIVDNGVTLLKVQVKSTRYKAPSGNYRASFTIKGGNNGAVTKVLSQLDFDFAFIACEDGTRYFIPKEALKNLVVLWKEYDKFKV